VGQGKIEHKAMGKLLPAGSKKCEEADEDEDTASKGQCCGDEAAEGKQIPLLFRKYHSWCWNRAVPGQWK